MSTKRKSKAVRFLENLVGEKLSLGLLLKSIRQGEEISQTDFAKILDISTQYLCDIEKGRRFVSPKVAAHFAGKLGYNPQHFVRICLQDVLDRDEIHLIINVQAA